MNDILAAYENARFEKQAVDPAKSPLYGAEMTDPMRRIRNAIEQSIRTEARLTEQARQTGEWGAAQARTPVEGSAWLPASLGAAGAAGAGATLESYLSSRRPRTAALEKAVKQVMGGEGKDFAGWVRKGLTPPAPGETIAIPSSAPAMAQALQNQPQPLAANAGALRRTWDQVKKRLQATSPRFSEFVKKRVGRSVDPSVVGSVLGTRAAPTTLSKKLTEETVTGTGRQKLREAVMSHPSVTKGQNVWKRSPALRGALKGIGVASLVAAYPYLLDRLVSDVSPETMQAREHMTRQIQLADLIRDWREKQFMQLAQAKGPGDVTAVPWAPPPT